MAEVAHPGEYHREPGFVCRRNHLVIADRTAGLDHAGRTRLDCRQQAIGETGEEFRFADFETDEECSMQSMADALAGE